MTSIPRRSRTVSPRRFAALLLLIVAPLSSAILARPAAAADGSGRWTLRTADNGYGSDRPQFGYTVGPGGRIEDGLVVVNDGDTTLRLAVQAANGVTTASGRLGLVAAGSRPTGLAAWIHFERDAVTVAPGTSATLPFSVAPPRDAAAGDHVGGVLATVDGAPGDGAVDSGGGHTLRIRLRVSGPLKPRLSIERLQTHYSGAANPLAEGEATVSYTIRNSGNTVLAARQAVSSSGPFGSWTRRAGRIADSPALLPGASWTVSAPVRDVAPAIRMTSTVTLTPLLTDAAGSIAPLTATESSGHAWTIPWTLLLVVGAVAALAGVVVRRRLRVTA